MKKLFLLPAFFFLAYCTDQSKQATPSPGILENTQESNTTDTSLLITDSVVVKDTNTADIEPMKKIN